MTLLDSLPAALQRWQNFYLLTGGAAATLTGLMFVAVTFGSSLVTRESARSARAFLDPIYVHFAQVLLTAAVLTIPVLTPRVLGALLLVLGCVRIVGLWCVCARFVEAQREHGDIELSDWVSSIVIPLALYGLVIVTGMGFWRQDALALLGLAVAQVVLLFLGLYGAWEMLVWMALEVTTRRENGAKAKDSSS